jgi:excisionase family DNA binding protein
VILTDEYSQSPPLRSEAIGRAVGKFEHLVDSKQAAELLGIHAKTLQAMARKGEVPAHRGGDLWRYRESELDAWLRSRVSSISHSCRN